MEISTLRPGLLVSLRTALSGNIQYTANTIESDHVDATGARRAKWETERVIADPDEHERATQARGKARSAITSVCAQSAFGLLCPESDRDKLIKGMVEAREIADQFNAVALITRITVNIIVGRVAADDVEAVRAINGEIRDLLDRMDRGVEKMDVKTIREAANAAKALSTMLSPAASARAEAAIEAARRAARAIVKAGETAAIEVDTIAIETIRASRTAFLDLDSAPTEVRAPEETGRAIDFEAETPKPATPKVSLFEIEV